MDSVRLALLFACLFAAVECQTSKAVCKVVKSNNGYIPPSPPYSYIIKYREYDFEKGASFLKEIYFDMSNQRYMIQTSTAGLTTKTVRNYKQNVEMTYDETDIDYYTDDASCYVESLSYEWDDEDTNEWSVNKGFQLINYGLINFRQQSINKKVRGVPAVEFTGCIYNKNTEETSNVTYSWTVKNLAYFGPFGPVNAYRELLVENKYDYYSDWEKKTTQRDIFWYQEDPYFRDEDFQLPSRALCWGDSEKTLPYDAVTHSYSTESEIITSFKIRNQLFQKLNIFKSWVSIKHDVIREDFVAVNSTEGEGKIFPDTPVTAVHDFANDIGYVLNKKTQNCQVVPLANLSTDPDISKSGGIIKMAGPNSIFNNYEFTFKIKETYRDIPIQVWISDINEETYFGRPANILLELSFLDETWEDKTFNRHGSRIPIRLKKKIIHTDGLEPQNFTNVVNFYNSDSQEPDLEVFFIWNCFAGLPRIAFIFDLKVAKTVSDQKFYPDYEMLILVKDQFHEAIANRAGISFLRARFYTLSHSGSGYRVYMVFHDAPKITGVTTKQVTAKAAATNLENLIKTQGLQFSVEFHMQHFMSYFIKLVTCL